MNVSSCANSAGAAAALSTILSCAAALAAAEDKTPPRKPNIVILLADDLGYADVGFHGCKDIPTPNLDKLAKSGVRCTSGYVTGPYCSPTRAALLTGRYQQRFGHEFNPGGGRRSDEIGLPMTETTLADRLKSAGYATALVGKWHLGNAAKFHPQRRGFDEFFGFLGGAHPYFPGRQSQLLRGAESVVEKHYLTDALAREAVDFIERHQQQSFFLYLAFNAVHTPLQGDDARLARFAAIADPKRRTYAAMLSAMDDAIGRVLEKLRTTGLEKNTLIFFFSDNGGPVMAGTTINGSSNHPLRGSKRTTLEGGIRVPFVVSWKGKLPAGKVFDQPVVQLDVLPTALAAVGATVRSKATDQNASPANANAETKHLDGVDLLPYLTGKNPAAPHETLYWRLGAQLAIRRGDWKLVRYDMVADSQVRGRGRAAAAVTGFKLYNLAKDIGETNDLSVQQPDKVKELESTWRKWSAELANPLWGPKNSF